MVHQLGAASAEVASVRLRGSGALPAAGGAPALQSASDNVESVAASVSERMKAILRQVLRYNPGRFNWEALQ